MRSLPRISSGRKGEGEGEGKKRRKRRKIRG